MEPNENEPKTNPEPPTNPTPPAAETSPIAGQFAETPPVAAAANTKDGKALPSAFELFGMSKKAVLLNLVPFLLIVLLPSVLSAVTSVSGGHNAWLQNYAHSPRDIPSSLIGLWAVTGLYSLLTIAARPLLQVMSVKGQTTTFGEAFSKGLHYFWRMLGLSVLVGLIVVVGLILLIVPGLIFIRRYFLAPYFLVDQDLGIREAMRRSAAATKNHSGAVWGVIGVTILLELTSVVPFVGPFVAAVLGFLYSCAPALRYQQLKG